MPDTNVLLNLYRYNTQARSDLLAVLRSLGERLWVPHQVLSEFWKNRETAIRDPDDAAERVLDSIEKQRAATIQALRTWANRVAFESGSLDELQAGIEGAFMSVVDAITSSFESETTNRALDTNSDPVLASLEQILDGRVGPPLSPEELEEHISIGRKRIEAGTPPGYMDLAKAKGEDLDAALGDYLVWEQILREANRRRVDVLLVTGDVKEDWWRRVEGETRGPRPELVQEMRNRAGVRLFMLRPESLLVRARVVLQVDVRDESVEDVERVDRLVTSRDLGEWSEAAVHQLMARLDSEAPVQAEAIRRAAMEGGFVAREDIYDLGGYEETRTLRGFTRPANRIAQELRDRGLVPDTAPDPLEAVYDPTFSWVLARGFRIPPQLADVLQRRLEGS